jgi:hypothetical protein
MRNGSQKPLLFHGIFKFTSPVSVALNFPVFCTDKNCPGCVGLALLTYVGFPIWVKRGPPLNVIRSHVVLKVAERLDPDVGAD